MELLVTLRKKQLLEKLLPLVDGVIVGSLFTSSYDSSIEDIETICNYIKTRGKKVYIVMDDFISEDELPDLYYYFRVISKLDVDGIQETARSALEGGFGAGDVAQIGGSLGSAALYALYAQVLLGLTVAGIILLIVRRRRFVCMPGPVTIPKGHMFNALFLNVGFILFFCACLVMIVVSLFAG